MTSKIFVEQFLPRVSLSNFNSLHLAHFAVMLLFSETLSNYYSSVEDCNPNFPSDSRDNADLCLAVSLLCFVFEHFRYR